MSVKHTDKSACYI